MKTKRQLLVERIKNLEKQINYVRMEIAIYEDKNKRVPELLEDKLERLTHQWATNKILELRI